MTRNLSTRRIVSLAMLVSLNVILTCFASVDLRVGAIVGVMVDLVGFFLHFPYAFGKGEEVKGYAHLLAVPFYPMGAKSPHFTFSAVLTGLISGLFALYGETWLSSITRLMVAIGSTIAVTLPGACISFMLTVPIYALLVSRFQRMVPGTPIVVGYRV